MKPYVPDTGIDYPSDPHARILNAGPVVKEIAFDETYPYLDDSADYKWQQFKCYAALWPWVFLLNRFVYGVRVHGRKNLKACKHLFGNGAMAVCNHVYRWDAISVLDAIKYRTVKIPMLSTHFKGKDNWFLRSVGGIPIPDGRSGLAKFNEAFDEYHRRKSWFLVYPEAARWDFYAPIRSFKLGSFNMAYKYNIPVVPLVISYRERKGIYKLFGKGPCVDIHIGNAIVPDTSAARKEEVKRVCVEAHQQMVRMAGWEGINPWPAYDE